MELISIRAYARLRGVSHTLINKQVKAGLIPTQDGKINPEAADAARLANVGPARGRGTKVVEVKPVPAAAVEATRRTLEEAGQPTVGGMTFMQARTANEILKVQRHKLELERAKGRMVEKGKTKLAVFQLARQERDAWLNWPARTAAQLAAELNVDPQLMRAILTRHVREHLAELADPQLRLG